MQDTENNVVSVTFITGKILCTQTLRTTLIKLENQRHVECVKVTMLPLQDCLISLSSLRFVILVLHSPLQEQREYAVILAGVSKMCYLLHSA